MRDVLTTIELLYEKNLGGRAVAKPVAEPAALPRPVLRDSAFVVETASA